MTRAGGARDRGGATDACASIRERPHRQVYLNWLENIRPGASRASSGGGTSSRSGTRGDETYVAEPPDGGGAWEPRPRRARHVVLVRALAVRDARLARARRPSCAPSTRRTSSRPARDIIFLWVARMVMMGIEFTGELPFTDVPIHSVIQAPDGRRMSKSLGTGHRPARRRSTAHGADALRFGLLAMSSRRRTCASTRTGSSRARDLANKLWNASRLVLLRVEDVEPGAARRDGRGPLDRLAARAR